MGFGGLRLAEVPALFTLGAVALAGVFVALGPVWTVLFALSWLVAWRWRLHIARLAALRRWALVVAAGILGFFLIDRVPIPITTGDTYGLVDGARALDHCVGSGTWTRCPGADSWGLQQHVLAMPFAWTSLHDHTIVTGLAVVNLVAFLVLLVLVVRTRTISPPGRAVTLLALLLGPPLVYSIQTFGEGLSLVVDCALVLALLRGSNPWVIGALAAYACTAKETAVLGVLPIAAAVVLMVRERRRPMAIALVAGCAAGVVLDGLFNLWRYGRLGNVVYDASSNVTLGVWLKLKVAAALWVSPGGGAFPYWFLGAALALVLPILALRSGDRRRVAAAALVLVGLALQTALLSAWWAPFGWYCWGPRLLLPTLAMAVFAAVAAFEPELRAAASWLRRRFVAVGAPLLALAIVSATANLGFLVDPKSTLFWFYSPHTAACPSDIQTDRAAYYHCVDGVMSWQPHNSLWTTGAAHINSLDGQLLIVAALLATFATLLRPEGSASACPESKGTHGKDRSQTCDHARLH